MLTPLSGRDKTDSTQQTLKVLFSALE